MISRTPARPKFRICFWLISLGLAVILGFSQKAEGSEKTAMDIKFSSGGYLFKVRPLDYSQPSDRFRFDFLLGRQVGRFKIYGYWKSDTKNRTWLGTRLEYEREVPALNIITNLQARFFFPLNEHASHHYYVVPSVFRPLRSGRILVGLLGYGKKTFGEPGHIYLGPVAAISLSPHLSLKLSYGPDLLGRGGLLYFKTSIKIN